MTDDIVAFIRARLDEDEQQARAATEGMGWSREPHSGRWRSAEHGCVWGAVDDESGGVIVFDEGAPNEAQAAHIARHDPARVLREVEAKRRTLEEHKPMDGVGDRIVGCHTCSWRDDWEELHVEFPCTTIRLLALAYTDHPDYREDWRR